MSVSKPPVNVAPTGEAVGRVGPSGADSAFVYAEFRHRSQILRVAVLCPTCFQQPEWQVTEREAQNGYNVRSHKYLDGDRPCYDCGKEPVKGAA